MTDNKKRERIRTPFTSKEHEFLRSLSAYAKDNNLLSGYQRHVLFEVRPDNVRDGAKAEIQSRLPQ